MADKKIKKYLVDTNVFLRFLLQYEPKYFQKAKNLFLEAQKKKVILILVPQVVFEIDYVLRGVYSLRRKESAKILLQLVSSPDLQVEERSLLLKTITRYEKTNVDLVDIYLQQKARNLEAQVFSFDQDFKKIQKE